MAGAKKTTEKKPEPEPTAEVSKRTADGSDDWKCVKDFVVLGDEPADDGHDANKAAVLQEAIQRGLHPRGDVSFDGGELLDDGVSRVLHYSVDVVPASSDSEPEKTTTPRDQVESGD